MAGDGSFKAIKESISAALIDMTRSAGQIANEDLAFQRSLNPSCVPLLDQQSSRLLQLTHKLTRAATSGTDIVAPQIYDLDSVEDNWRGLVDVFDNLLEKADACLDEFTGVIKKLSPAQEESIRNALPPANEKKRNPGRDFRNRYIAKPQLLFADVPTNDEATPFKPLLHSKPHAITPLEKSLTLVPAEDGPSQYALQDGAASKRPSIQYKYPPATYIRADPILYLPYDGTQATLVDTPEAMMAMLQELKTAKEIAIDLEHHDEHSYNGIVSLMQISTRDKDWIVDTLKPWRRDLEILNEVFADPQILKVLHGSAMDIIWLQRDLGLYVVGLFDTFHASRSLGYPKKSLAYLLKRFANFDAAKQYQMADWRIRPIPEEMFNYARSDTHFLLYIYDNLRNELIANSDPADPGSNLIDVVLKHSKDEALQRYERPVYDVQRGLGALGWYNMLSRNPALFSREQFAVFRAVHQWRDDVARQEDESVRHIMPKSVLFNIAREMPLDMPSLLGCSYPMSPIYKKRINGVLDVVKAAKQVGMTGPEVKDVMADLRIHFPPVHADQPKKHKKDQAMTESSIDKEEGQEPQEGTLNGLLAKADNSGFWGSTIRNATDSFLIPREKSHGESLRLALPLPQLNAEIFEDSRAMGNVATGALRIDPGARAEHQYIKDRRTKEDNIFILKQSGGSRKRKAAELVSPSGSVLPHLDDKLANEYNEDGDEVSVNGQNNEQSVLDPQLKTTREQKYQSRMEKKRLKREKALLEVANVGQAQESGELEAFDYAKAPSLLHAPKGKAGIMEGGVNPYNKSRNAPKGMRKMKKEAGGRSLTFKPQGNR